MSRKAGFLLIILCFVAVALGGCAQNAEREAAGSDAAVAIAHIRHPDSAFYVNMGDLVDNGQDASQ